jgi:hypothetical protein
VIERRRDKSESRLQKCAVVADHRIVVVGPILANTRISYVTPSLQHETVRSARAHQAQLSPITAERRTEPASPERAQALL